MQSAEYGDPRPSIPHTMDGYSSPSTPHFDSYRDSTEQSLIKQESNTYAGANNEPARARGSATNSANGGSRRPKWFWALIGLAVLVVVVLAVALGVVFGVVKRDGDGSTSGGHSGSHGGDEGAVGGNLRGGDGSEVTLADGKTFTYENPYGGTWAYDPSNPFKDDAQCNSWTPALNEKWTWGENRIYGVNLGGLFVLEPFISPALFQRYPDTVDEWTLSEAMAADTANGGLDQIEEHYKTFITEQDIAMIAGAGLNWIRLPVPFFAIETWPGEPYLAKKSWPYILRVIEWCRKYGLRVKLDLHALPGSQNGYNHSGKFGQVDFLYGTMGLANAQRALYYIRVFTEYFSQPEYQNVVGIFGIVNEALESTIGKDALRDFYYEAYTMIREITGTGEGNGFVISLHDGFSGLAQWSDFLPGADRLAFDLHPYFAFEGGPNLAPIATSTDPLEAGGQWPLKACDSWGPNINKSQSESGITFGGEFSNGFNDCGLFLLGTPNGPVNPNCETLWNQWESWNETTKAGVQAFAEASMDTLQNWFFWTWKIGEAESGKVEAPLWSYKLGYENGWMPKDPRTVVGRCEAIGAKVGGWDGTFEPWQTGGEGAGSLSASATQTLQWPPARMSGIDVPVSELPVYTATGSVITLAPTPTSFDLTGWANEKDTVGAPAPIEGCSYPDPYDATDAPAPTGCAGSITPFALSS